jgi:predicted N-acetyltransferase YhbS
MIKIREYNDNDLHQAASLISETFRKYNYKDNQAESSEEYAEYYGSKSNIDDINRRFKNSSLFFVAEHEGQVIGVLIADKNRIVNLFVKEGYQRGGIGNMLFYKYVCECKKMGYQEIVLRSQLHAIPFYQACGFKKTTGIRHKHGLTIQPMKKKLS